MHFRLRRLAQIAFLAASLGTLTAALRAQVVFTFSGTNTTNSEPVIFSLTTSASFYVTGQPQITIDETDGVPVSAQYVWGKLGEDEVAPSFIGAISGSSLTGSFAVANEQVAAIGLINDLVGGTSSLVMIGYAATETGFGQLLPGEVPFRFFYGVIPVTTAFLAPEPGTSIGSYFVNYSGTYTFEENALLLLGDSPFGGGEYSEMIAITSLTINGVAGVSAVPEPATYAAIASACALGLTAWRRRRARA